MLRHASQYMIASVIAAAFGFLGAATFTRLLAPGDYGVYVVGVGISGYISSILFTWVRFSVMRLQSEGVQRDLRLTALAGYGISVATIPLVFLVITRVSQRDWLEIAGAIVLALGLGLFEMGQEIMRARFQVREFVIGAALRAVMSFVFCIIAIELGMGGLGLLAGAALAYFVSAAISARSVWGGPRARVDLGELALFFRLGFVFTLTAFIYAFQGSLDRLFLAWHSSEVYSGLYGASADLTRQIIQIPAGSIAAAAFPIAVSSLVQSGAAKAREQLARFGEVLLAVSVPSAIGLALTVPYLASFILGPAFREAAASIVPILAIAWLFQCTTQFYVHVSFHLAKRPEWSLLQGLTGVAVNIALIWPLTDRWGMPGTALSFLISEACGIVVGVALTRFSHPMPNLLGPLARILLACGVMAGVVLALERLLPVPGALAFGVLAASGMLVYALAAIALNICEARTMLHTVAVRLFSAPRENIGPSL